MGGFLAFEQKLVGIAFSTYSSSRDTIFSYLRITPLREFIDPFIDGCIETLPRRPINERMGKKSQCHNNMQVH